MKRTDKYLTLLGLFFFLLGLWHLCRFSPAATNVAPQRQETAKILLVPLDGRPPCRQFVIDAGHIAGLAVTPPPNELQDYYSQPGDTEGMKQWLSANIETSQAVILSIDQLLYGGLLTAREKEKTPAERQQLIAFLRQLHEKHPAVPIYAFSILPRQTPQDTIDGYWERSHLLSYSRLKGRQAEGLPVSTEELQKLEAAIPAEILARYLSHFEENRLLNEELIQLTKEGVFTQLVLGQDDGEPYTIPNIEKKRLQQYIHQQNLPPDKVFLTHGADEIALSLLSLIQNRRAGFKPRVLVKYAAPYMAQRIMPYMAVSIDETVKEKIALLGGEETTTAEDADFTLYISACDKDTGDVAARKTAVKQLKANQQEGAPTALVDLSKHFEASETVLPLLIEADYPVNNLIAYAGWNTTSNAIGTALAQASIYEACRQQTEDRQEMIGLTAANLTFLQGRILEDYFYLKDDIELVNQNLKKAGYINTADLDLEHNYRWANRMLQNSMQQHIASYKQTKSARTPVKFTSPAGDFTLMMQDLTAELSYPWPRTFEIWLHATPSFAMPSEK
ncbi:DUF4127 family protein [Selenomonas sp.]|uniref:DUF4127 family protein n=1 Tax=Selenomonas sp. TaxID=2053611 RepID=UPI0025EA00CB|nr:DUF4127 family protein [Selenomonas sp.]